MQELEKLATTTLQSSILTHHRLKYLGEMAQSTEDHISRLALGLSISQGAINSRFTTSTLSKEPVYEGVISEKQLRGKTLFKDDLVLWLALILKIQEPADYSEWRGVFVSHWERGVEILIEKSIHHEDWLEVVSSCLNN